MHFFPTNSNYSWPIKIFSPNGHFSHQYTLVPPILIFSTNTIFFRTISSFFDQFSHKSWTVFFPLPPIVVWLFPSRCRRRHHHNRTIFPPRCAPLSLIWEEINTLQPTSFASPPPPLPTPCLTSPLLPSSSITSLLSEFYFNFIKWLVSLILNCLCVLHLTFRALNRLIIISKVFICKTFLKQDGAI